MVKNFSIIGERCSGTNYLYKLLELNFNCNEDILLSSQKHYFKMKYVSNRDTEDILFICIIRNLYEWLNSFYKCQFDIVDRFETVNEFLNNEIKTLHNNWIEKIWEEDLNFLTEKRFKNIFELRYVKTHFMLEVLPKIVKNCIFIKYEDLINNFDMTMHRLKNAGLEVKDPNNFPSNIYCYKRDKNKIFEPDRTMLISKEEIIENKWFHMFNKFDYQLNYIKKKEDDSIELITLHN